MKPLFVALILLLLFVQYHLWFASDGLINTIHLNHLANEQQQKNSALTQKNTELLHDIAELKRGGLAIENRARTELGMVKKGELFYRIIKANDAYEK